MNQNISVFSRYKLLTFFPHTFILFFFCVSILFSCTEETEVLSDEQLGIAYVPVSIGKFWVYKTDSVIYNKTLQVNRDSSTSYIMEEIVDTFRDSRHQLIYTLDIFHRRDTLAGWDLIGTSYIQKDQFNYTKKENGLSFIRMIFPVRINKSWNGNSLIHPNTIITVKGEPIQAFNDWTYYYKSVGKADTVENVSYPNVVEVSEVDDNSSIIAYRYSTAKYALSIGLIYREVWILDSQNTQPGLPWSVKGEQGYILKQRLISYN